MTDNRRVNFRNADERIAYFQAHIAPGAVFEITLGRHRTLARVTGFAENGMVLFDYRDESGAPYRGRWERDTLAYCTLVVRTEADWLLQEIGV
jgi:hypothetical protein